jgi:magnesium chelatase family protein
LPEWDRRVIEVLREPLESGSILVSRAARQTVFPAAFQLVAAMNPCPCGWLGHASARCTCSLEQVRRYRSRVSGALYDRIDMAIEVPPVAASEMGAKSTPTGNIETSGTVRQRVGAAHARQVERQGKANARLTAGEVDRHCERSPQAETLLAQAMSHLSLSARGYHRVLKVARTIADLQGSPSVEPAHVAEAIAYRREIAVL